MKIIFTIYIWPWTNHYWNDEVGIADKKDKSHLRKIIGNGKNNGMRGRVGNGGGIKRKAGQECSWQPIILQLEPYQIPNKNICVRINRKIFRVMPIPFSDLLLVTLDRTLSISATSVQCLSGRLVPLIPWKEIIGPFSWQSSPLTADRMPYRHL